jgi:hypothetical protein
MGALSVQTKESQPRDELVVEWRVANVANWKLPSEGFSSLPKLQYGARLRWREAQHKHTRTSFGIVRWKTYKLL